MSKPHHILNGDALNEQFPGVLEGERIIMRECLLEGDVAGNSPEELYRTRARYLSSRYEEVTDEWYYKKTVVELDKIRNIIPGTDISLWFEEDLFCQVNLWYVSHLLTQTGNHSAFLVLPDAHCRYNFGAMNQADLIAAFRQRQPLDVTVLSELWTCYQKQDGPGLEAIASRHHHEYPFLRAAVQAHRDRISGDENPGRPIRVLTEIIEELGTTALGPVFKAFHQREPVYGYGDLQIQRMLEELIHPKG
ncbi:MAG: hypothetical protein KDC57_07870 [Saprospiraceae bacterium]|nr:hypothetical protein [Saprospiraceae bacterium]